MNCVQFAAKRTAILHMASPLGSAFSGYLVGSRYIFYNLLELNHANGLPASRGLQKPRSTLRPLRLAMALYCVRCKYCDPATESYIELMLASA